MGQNQAKFKYLETVLTEDGKYQTGMRSRIRIAKDALQKFSKDVSLKGTKKNN